MYRILPFIMLVSLAGCVTSLAKVPAAEKRYPVRVAVLCEDKDLSGTIVKILDRSGLVKDAHNPDGGPEGMEEADVVLSARILQNDRKWKRNTWCYVTTIPGLPFAFITSSILLAPILGPYGGYIWFPPNITPIVTIETTVTVQLGLDPDASIKITESASRMCYLRRCWVQCGRIDDKWFSTVLGGNWDRDYKTDKCKWTAFFRPGEIEEKWAQVKGIAYHNIACRAVTWLEKVFEKLEAER